MTDDRGYPAALCRTKALPPAATLTLRLVVGWCHRRWQVSVVVGAFCGLAFILCGLILLFRPGQVYLAMAIGVGSLAGLISIFIPLGYMRQQALQAAAAHAIVRHGHCARCGYDLRATPRAPDGCSLCPECGAAWKLPPEDVLAIRQRTDAQRGARA